MHRDRSRTPYWALGTFVLVGCGRSPARVDVAADEPPAVAVAAAAEVAQPPANPVESPPTFPFPDDPAGRALPGVVAPAARAGLPAERITTPKPRTPPARVVNPDPPTKLAAAPPPAGLPKPGVGPKPAASPERLPANLAATAPRPVLAVRPVTVARAPDPSAPPPVPATDRPAPYRPADDGADVAAPDRAVVVTLGPAGFLRLFVPDPFELAGHVPSVEPPAVAPVVVPPRRPW